MQHFTLRILIRFINIITNRLGTCFTVRGLLISCLLSVGITSVFAQQGEGDTFKVWVFSDAHVGTDIQHGVESLAEAIRQSESGLSGINPAPPMDWDIGICLGDFAGGFEAPEDPEG